MEEKHTPLDATPPDTEPVSPPDAPAGTTAEPDDDAFPLPALDTDAPDEEAELERAMERALLNVAEDEPADDGADLSGAFSHADKPRFDARLVLGPLLGLVAVAIVIWALLADRRPEGKLVINEVMTSNRSTIVDETLGTPDWVELYNGSGSDINVAGFGLSDSMKNSYRYTLPDVVVPAGGYLVIFFTGGTEAADENPLCAGFGLSRNGDLLVLVDAHYELLCEVDVPALEANAAYARRADGSYGVTYVPTPYGENSVP